MENNDTNTDYHKFVRVGDQKWEIVEITIRIIFFCLRFVFTIFYTGSFQVPPKKNHPHLKCQFPPKISIWPKSLQYERSEKWLSPSLPSPRGDGGANYGLHVIMSKDRSVVNNKFWTIFIRNFRENLQHRIQTQKDSGQPL